MRTEDLESIAAAIASTTMDGWMDGALSYRRVVMGWGSRGWVRSLPAGLIL